MGCSLVALAWLAGVALAGDRTVHVVFKTHFDLGFTDLPDRVEERYLHDHIPQAVKTARQLAHAGGDRWVWTLGTWLVHEYLALAPAPARAELEQAVREGWIVWHAYPFTGVNEIIDESLFRHALGLAHELDRRFGRQTIAANLTDVPGDTRASVRLLAEAGIEFLHVGVNGAAAVPEVPPLFVWREPTGREIVVAYHANYGGTTEAPGGEQILHVAFTNDNQGPPKPEQIAEVFATLRHRYPGAQVRASTLDAFARAIRPWRAQLPVVTAEIGSSWVHSAGTDPRKYAELRALMRLRTRWLATGRLSPDDPAGREFATQLLLASEHTGGIDEKEHIDFDHWTVEQLAQVRHTLGYRTMERSWADARAYLTRAVRALGATSLAEEARAELASLTPRPTPTEGMVRVDPRAPLVTTHFAVQLDPASGAVVRLQERATGREWASPQQPLAKVWHESFSEDDYERFLRQYLRTQKIWAKRDFGKPGCGAAGAVAARRETRLREVWRAEAAVGVTLLLRLEVPEVAPIEYGLPRQWELQLFFPSSHRAIACTVQWFGKRAVRLPEAYWLSFVPAGCDPRGWRVVKLGQEVSPLEVVARAGRALHGIDRGLVYRSPTGGAGLCLESLDCPVVAPGIPALLDFHDQVPDLSAGWHFNLWNNKWGTNFPTWYEEDARFRFLLTFES